ENIEEEKFNELFTVDKPIIFNFHGYTNVIEELIYRRKHRFDIIHGYEEEGTITTPFDMRVINSIDRYHLVIDALDLLNSTNKELKQSCIDSLDRHNKMIRETGKELPEVDNWKWID
ncbi:MAG TPA: phosphoketolase, partial [Bacilli bacterium]|nr:phosphoketolase [Bacilli bacterium]